jgi:hypothetical protein
MDLTGLLQKKELRCLLVNHKNLSLPNNIYKSGKSSRSRCVCSVRGWPWCWSCQSAGGRGSFWSSPRWNVGVAWWCRPLQCAFCCWSSCFLSVVSFLCICCLEATWRSSLSPDDLSVGSFRPNSFFS